MAQTPTGGSSGEYWTMGASLIQQRRVEDEGLRIVNSCQTGRRSGGAQPPDLTVLSEEAPANSVPAAAVIRRGRALFGIIGRKGRVGGSASRGRNPEAQPRNCLRYCGSRVRER